MKTSTAVNIIPKIEHLFINVIFKENDFNSYFINLEKEINKIRKEYTFKIKSIYVAGDNLLELSSDYLIKLLNLIKPFTSNDLIEYSFECSYAGVFQDKLKILKDFHVNRLIWKVITFQQQLLKQINNNYQSTSMINNIKNAIKLGYNNFSLELKYNIFNQQSPDIVNDIKQSLLLNAPHISYDSYNDEENINFKQTINKALQKEKYNNYEVFSYCKSINFQSQQTLAYLNLKNWYGLGPNANGFIANAKQKISINNNKEWKTTSTILNEHEYYQLFLFQGLMLKSGIILNENNSVIINYYQKIIEQLIEQQLLIIIDNMLKATNKGWILLNEILTVIINTK